MKSFDLLAEFRYRIKEDLFSKQPCANNDHYFVRYDDGNIICSKCGRFAKVGRLVGMKGDESE